MNVKKGEQVTFKGYSEQPPEGEDYLKKGQSYEVVEVNAKDKSVVVRVDNPDFDSKKKETEKNPKTILLDIFEEEFTAAKGGKGKAAAAEKDEGEDEGEQEEAAAPAPKAKGKAATKAPAKKATKAGKTAKPAKAAKTSDEGEENDDPYADLSEENEDQDILGLVNEAEDILELARETAEEASAVEYKLGGILFHIRRNGAYKELDKRYTEKGGFSLYVLEQLNVEYRKAMYLIDIYYKWNKFGLEAAKVAAIGWAKAAKIAAVMTEDTAEELLELAETNTVADLVENIKTSYKEVGGSRTPGEKKVLKTFKFRLFEDQAAAVEEVLNSTAAAMEFKNLDQAFEHIVMEWATEHGVQPKAKEETPAKARKSAPSKAKAKA